MAKKTGSRINRREFLKQSGFAVGTVAIGAVVPPGCVSNLNFTGGNYQSAVIETNKSDEVGSSKPVQWAIEQLRQSLSDRNIAAQVGDAKDVPSGALCIRVDRSGSGDEALNVGMRQDADRQVFNATGSDIRGMVYALMEATDIVKSNPNPLRALARTPDGSEHPANQIRSAMRMFVSDVEDKSWYYDKNFWRDYLTMLVTHRFNRFNLALGLGYDGPVSPFRAGLRRKADEFLHRRAR
jgi:hypothetical protein